MLEPCEGKLSSTVLRGAGTRKGPWPTRSRRDMNITKRDIADIALVWMGLSLLLALLTSFVTLGTIIGMTDEQSQFMTKSVATTFQSLHLIVLIGVNYVIFFKRAIILNLVFPNSEQKEASVPESLSALGSYAFWIRLLGIFTFLTSGTRFFSQMVMELATKRQFQFGSFWMIKSGTQLVSAVLALLIIWKADWISDKLGKIKSSNPH